MKTLLILLLLITPAYSAELLIQAQDSPFEKGAKKGDIIVVRPDGHIWGREECLPRYMVIKLPNVKVEDVKHYEEQLTEMVERTDKSIEPPQMESKLIRLRKYNIIPAEVDAIKFVGSVSTVPTKSVATYLTQKIATKTLAVEKASIEAVSIAK